MADKLRVYDLARKLGLTNKEVMDFLEKRMNITVKSHTSSISQEDAKKFEEEYKKHTSPSLAKTQTVRPLQSPNLPPAHPVEKAKRAVKLIKKPKPEPEKVEETPVQKEEIKEKTPVTEVAEKTTVSSKEIGSESKKNENLQKESAKETKDFSQTRKPFDKPFQQKPAFNKDKDSRQDVQGRFNRDKTQKPQDKKPAETSSSEERKSPIKRHIISPDTYEGKSRNALNKKKNKRDFEKDKFEEKEKQFNTPNKHHKKNTKVEKEPEKVTEIVLNQSLTVGELAEKLNITPAEIVKELMMSGILATVNQVIDLKTAKSICEKFEVTVLEESLEDLEKMTNPQGNKPTVNVNLETAVKRAPVVTIMGHVDHGKTTLLDSIRASKHKIVNTEVGGITQSIGAYTVKLDDKKIVFIDTPGHEAFTAMRARGAQSTDIAVLVVAADDGIMPQTIEAINHAKAANVPIIVAVNKMDKPEANPDRILQQLTEHGLVPEEWGGDTVCVKVSALQGTGLDELLEYILLLADIQDLKANEDVPAEGVVIEANLDKGKGPVATLLVQNGTLKIGDCIAVGNVGGKVRALLSDSGERVKEAGPSTPVEVLGLTEVPQAGDKFEVYPSEKEMRAVIDERKEKERTSRLEAISPLQVKTDTVNSDEEETKELNIIIKANTHGSAEAVSASVQQLSSKSVVTNIVHIGVGDISEADVMLAIASKAIIIGFSVKEDNNAVKIAEQNKIDIRRYDIIYEILEDIEKTMLGLLSPETKEVETGKLEVRQVFTIGKTTKIAGCYVLEGKIQRNSIATVERGGKEIFKGTISHLKRFKDDVKEVAMGYECGVSFNKFNDIEEGDIIRAFTTQEIEREALV